MGAVEDPLRSCSLFQVTVNKLPAVEKVSAVPQEVDVPWVCRCTDELKSWESDQVVSRVNASFGTKHRNDPQYNAMGRVNNPMKQKQGKVETEAFVNQVFAEMGCTLHDVKAFTPNQWSMTSWQFGYSSSYACNSVTSDLGLRACQRYEGIATDLGRYNGGCSILSAPIAHHDSDLCGL